MTLAERPAKVQPAEKRPTLALNPASGVIHTWGCGLGPARGGIEARFANHYVSVPAIVVLSFAPELVCTRCRPEAG